MTPEAHFRATAPIYMRRLLTDFPELNQLDAAAIFGNLGHESKGLTDLQEDAPTVKGSRGGYGWAQWTGPRRRAYEAYCQRTGKNPAADETNYAYLFLELNGTEGTEGKALANTRAAQGLDAKVEAFELAFLRAGVKHYPSRKKWAAIALEAFRAFTEDEPRVPPAPIPDPPRTSKGRAISGWTILGIVVALALAIAAFTIRF